MRLLAKSNRASRKRPALTWHLWWSLTQILHKNDPARRKVTAMRQISRPLSSRGAASDSRSSEMESRDPPPIARFGPFCVEDGRIN